MMNVSEDSEERYEAMELIVQVPTEGDSWFDRIFDLISAECNSVELEDGEYSECSCGMQAMGGMTGTLDEAFAWTTNVGKGLQPIDLARAIIALTDHTFNSLGTHEEQIVAENVIKVIQWARKEIEFEESWANRDWEDEEDDDE